MNNASSCKILIDTGCNTVGIISPYFSLRNSLRREHVKSRTVTSYEDKEQQVDVAVQATIDIGGFKSTIWLWEAHLAPDQHMILGTPWLSKMGVVLEPEHNRIRFSHHGLTVPIELPSLDIREISANAFNSWRSKSKKDRNI